MPPASATNDTKKRNGRKPLLIFNCPVIILVWISLLVCCCCWFVCAVSSSGGRGLKLGLTRFKGCMCVREMEENANETPGLRKLTMWPFHFLFTHPVWAPEVVVLTIRQLIRKLRCRVARTVCVEIKQDLWNPIRPGLEVLDSGNMVLTEFWPLGLFLMNCIWPFQHI